MSNTRSIIPKGGNDIVMTPPYLADKLVRYFIPPNVSVLEPCAGNNAFVDALSNCNGLLIDWCEISKGRDFFDYKEKHDWIITNPPFSQFRAFLKHSMELADNIVFLSLINAFFMKARLRDMKESNFNFHTIMCLATPPAPWPQFGIQLGAIYIKKDYNGDVKFI